jgi:signal peptidase II
VRERVLLATVFVFAVALDQITKFIVNAELILNGPSVTVIGSLLRLQHVRNRGAAFGITYGSPTVMLIITAIVTAALLYLFISGIFDPGSFLGRFAVVIILGGAAGNLIDRILFGEVIDFINMGIGSYRWPTYNVADINLTIGVILLIALTMFTQHEPDGDASNNIADTQNDQASDA